MKRNMEVRLKDIQLDFNGEQRKIGGYINVTERESETLYSQKRSRWFKETMKKGVFTRALQKNDSIPLLLEHDWDKQLAHTANGTLELREDAIGLRFDAVVSEDTYADIQARNIGACSFGFKVNEEVLEEVNPKLEKRYVTNIDLFEVSLVANPAYTGSLVEQRNLEEALQEMEEEHQEVEEERAKEKPKKDEESDKAEDTDEDKEEEVEDTKESDEKEKSDEDEKESEKDEESKEDKESDEDKEESDSEKEKKKEQRAIDIDTTSSDVKEDAKEVIQDVIEQTQQEAELYGEIASNIEEYKEEIKEEHNKEMQSLENESLYYTTMAYTKWLEVAKLKQINMNL
ncbi:hypothetical protein UT300009_30820 [Paraclostridium bifermentans]